MSRLRQGVLLSRRELQSLDHPTSDHVLLDDLVHVCFAFDPVPDPLGVNHHDRAPLTSIEAERLVGPTISNSSLGERFDEAGPNGEPSL